MEHLLLSLIGILLLIIFALSAKVYFLHRSTQEIIEAFKDKLDTDTNTLIDICGYLDLLEREEKSESVRRYLSQIKNRTDALKKLTEELFRYSVVTSTQKLNPERMDLVRALEESLLSFYGMMQEKGWQRHLFQHCTSSECCNCRPTV